MSVRLAEIVQRARAMDRAAYAIPWPSIATWAAAYPNLKRARREAIAQARTAWTAIAATRSAPRRAWRAAKPKQAPPVDYARP
jgi:hypothetical protein